MEHCGQSGAHTKLYTHGSRSNIGICLPCLSAPAQPLLPSLLHPSAPSTERNSSYINTGRKGLLPMGIQGCTCAVGLPHHIYTMGKIRIR